MAGMMGPARGIGPSVAAAVLAALGFLLTTVVFYPGYLTNDASYVHGFTKTLEFGDWQSPLMTLIWWAIDPVAPGPGSMFLLIAGLYWLGLGLCGWTMARRAGPIGAGLPVLGFVPPAFMLVAMIWRDILFSGTWLIAVALAYAANDRPPASRYLLQAAALVLVAAGVLLRPNAIVAAPLLAGYALWPRRFEWKRMALLFIPAVAAGYGLVNLAYYGVFDAKRQHAAHSLLVFDLGGITHFTGENQFPVAWTPAEQALLDGGCYDPERWDTYWSTDPCQFVMRRLEAPDDPIFGTPRLVAAWQRALLAHPLAYVQHRLTFMTSMLAGASLTLELYHLEEAGYTPLAQNPRFQALLALHERLEPTLLYRMGTWLIAALAIAALAWRRRTEPEGALALALTGSGAAYVLSYAAFGVATDFRYGHWCVVASLVAAAALVASASATRDKAAPE